MKTSLFLSLSALSFVVVAAGILYAQETRKDYSPKPDEQQGLGVGWPAGSLDQEQGADLAARISAALGA